MAEKDWQGLVSGCGRKETARALSDMRSHPARGGTQGYRTYAKKQRAIQKIVGFDSRD
ncbi:hypothetical protein [Microseira wollei]|uniref:hypothetical protein n=1 Tax=Microseira wollei TaxID=467598 RepID=UPI001CFED0F0|nr:hypothetical protein [Microseira wollei]